MNLWECCHSGCHTTATGKGGAVGLRAIGWYFEPGYDPNPEGLGLGRLIRDGAVPPTLLCPNHHPKPVPCHGRGVDDAQRGQPCAPCAAEDQADRIQKDLMAEKWVWLWRAWSADKQRICDCGDAFAKSASDAIGIALAACGGPYRHEVELIEVVPIALAISPSPEQVRAFRSMQTTFPLNNRSVS